jgi:4-hydroxy-tetrahydrodipicolinate reductase
MPAIALVGATGKMGRALVRAAAERADVRICGAAASPGSRHLDQDVGLVAGHKAVGVCVTANLAKALKDSEVAIDFALPADLEVRARAISAAGCAWVLGTTGLSAAHRAAIDAAAQKVAVLVSPNMSIAVQLLMRLVGEAARALPADFDIEIHETHHRDKIDAPSGTARRLGEIAAAARGQTLDEGNLLRSTASGARQPGAVEFSVARAGDIVGEHRVIFAGLGEQLVLEHRATDRMAFARGAMAAAVWIAGRPAGRYEMGNLIAEKQ